MKDFYAVIGPSQIYDLMRPLTVREKYYLEAHRLRYERRYGKPETWVMGSVGTFQGITIRV
jgi:hypothetical protein